MAKKTRPKVPRGFVTIRRAASLLRVSSSAITQWIREGKIPSYKFGRRTAIKREDLKLWTRERVREELLELLRESLRKKIQPEKQVNYCD